MVERWSQLSSHDAKYLKSTASVASSIFFFAAILTFFYKKLNKQLVKIRILLLPLRSSHLRLPTNKEPFFTLQSCTSGCGTEGKKKKGAEPAPLGLWWVLVLICWVVTGYRGNGPVCRERPQHGRATRQMDGADSQQGSSPRATVH